MISPFSGHSSHLPRRFFSLYKGANCAIAPAYGLNGVLAETFAAFTAVPGADWRSLITQALQLSDR
jgi:hypothetical protein